MNAIASDFDEQTYLACNPDVQRAVLAGQFRSGVSYQTADYVLREWSRYFSIEKIVPRGLARHQDLVICRK